MQITIVSDSSFCDKTGAAGCGFWIACSRGKYGGSKEFRTRLKNPNEAEFIGIVISLWVAIKMNLVQSGDDVLIQNDCTGALGIATGQRDVPMGNCEVAFMHLKRLIHRYNLVVSYRHVKSHSKTLIGARYTTVQLCDQRAKAAMRRRRAVFQTGQKIAEQIENSLQ